MRSANKT